MWQAVRSADSRHTLSNNCSRPIGVGQHRPVSPVGPDQRGEHPPDGVRGHRG